MRLATEEAGDAPFIHTGHLLAGILRAEGGPDILGDTGVTLAAVRKKLAELEPIREDVS
jgi:hypothetical protein